MFPRHTKPPVEWGIRLRRPSPLGQGTAARTGIATEPALTDDMFEVLARRLVTGARDIPPGLHRVVASPEFSMINSLDGRPGPVVSPFADPPPSRWNSTKEAHVCAISFLNRTVAILEQLDCPACRDSNISRSNDYPGLPREGLLALCKHQKSSTIRDRNLRFNSDFNLTEWSFIPGIALWQTP